MIVCNISRMTLFRCHPFFEIFLCNSLKTNQCEIEQNETNLLQAEILAAFYGRIIQQKGKTTMKSTIKTALVSLMTVALIGCGSSSASTTGTTESPKEEATKEEAPKEPELKEIELTKDNWQDYFEIRHTLGKMEDSDFYMLDHLSLVLKDEYKDKLSKDNTSEMTVTYSVPRALYYATLNGEQLEIGDEIDHDSVDLSAVTGWDQDYFDAVFDVRNQEPEPRTISFSNEEMISGKDIYDSTLQRKMSEDGMDIDPTDEGVWAITAPKDITMSEVKGKLYILE